MNVFTCQLKVCETHETEDGPKQGLSRLKKIRKPSPDETCSMFGFHLCKITSLFFYQKEVQIFQLLVAV